ncbi:phosphatase PAP2 family protein [Antrihabitans sp. YC2-6]|uniref:phosphatase PAP2 family protein n=1 Tax=Antrihabitans sp. YC2-6 TaxID=2799498 RepID=UPI0018F46D67|nr:phosphatase PAP2 family protein [Antrihabitans sp. YC2-6]MBJ8348591.1 inositol phosphorylceramide synthase [Antrihabitans sp. YC2-6]
MVRRLHSADAFLLGMLIACALLMVGIQIVAFRDDIRGPLVALGYDYVATPASYSVPWASLLIAMVGLNKQWRIVALSTALVLDVAMAGVRFLFLDNRFALGNGPTIVLTVLAVAVAVRWSGRQRTLALRGIAVGALLVMASKVAETWLKITSLSKPMVLDEYAQISDHALGNPSWLVGQLVEASGPVGNFLLHWIYSELSFAAIIVACWQLYRASKTPEGWPSHYLVRTFIVMGVIGPVFYFLFPVVGPMFAFGVDGNGLQVSNSWPNFVPPLDLTPSAIPFDEFTPRNCMPSMHTAWVLSIFIHSRGGPRWLRWMGTFWLIGTLLATLGFGYHYGVDLIAGAVLCLTVESALRDPERGWGFFRIRLVVGGAVLFVALLLSYRFLAVPIAQYPEISGPLLVGSLVAMVVLFYTTFFARNAAVRAVPSAAVKSA